MRKTLEAICLGLLAVLFWISYAALSGPQSLPERIPTHFDIAGQPNGWGSRDFLWFLPCVAVGLYLLLTVLGNIRFRRYNLPVRVTEANLPFIQDETVMIVAWIKCEILCLMTYLQFSIIESARNGSFRLSPLLIPIFLVAIFATVGWRLTTMIRGAIKRADSAGPDRRMENMG